MKAFAKSYLMTALAGAALVVAGCASGPARDVALTRAANRIVSAYQVGQLLAQASPAVSESLAKNLPASVGAADRNRLDKIVDNAYRPQHLRQNVVEALKRRAVESKHEKYLAIAADTLEKPLAQRMIRLQDKVTAPNFANGFKAFANQPASAARKKRLGIVGRLGKHMQVVSLQTAFNITLLEAMIRARNAPLKSEQWVGEAKIQQILGNTRAGISAKLRQQVPLMLLYVYRRVSTDTLARYGDMQSRAALVWTNRALARAIINTLAAASKPIPRKFESKE